MWYIYAHIFKLKNTFPYVYFFLSVSEDICSSSIICCGKFVLHLLIRTPFSVCGEICSDLDQLKVTNNHFFLNKTWLLKLTPGKKNKQTNKKKPFKLLAQWSDRNKDCLERIEEAWGFWPPLKYFLFSL